MKKGEKFGPIFFLFHFFFRKSEIEEEFISFNRKK